MQIALRPPIRLETDEDLVRVSRDNPGYRFEREEDGTIIVSPTSTDGGGRSMAAAGQLWEYAKLAGGKVYDSNTGFGVGPGERVLSPDASWLSRERIDALAPGERKTFWAISPDVVIEVASESDTFAKVIRKIEIFIERGSSYAVAIDPRTREVRELGTPPPGPALDFDAIIDA